MASKKDFVQSSLPKGNKIWNYNYENSGYQHKEIELKFRCSLTKSDITTSPGNTLELTEDYNKV